MADSNAQSQTPQTRQDISSVVLLDTNLTKLNDGKIKGIGLYTKSDLDDLRRLLIDLNKSFTEDYGLYDNQEITIRINGETQNKVLRTELNFPSIVEKENPGKRREVLFLSDIARIIIGIAKTCYALWQPDELRVFTQSLDELKMLRSWANSNDEYLDESDLIYNYKEVHKLLVLVTSIFERQTGQSLREESAPIEITSPEQVTGTATVPVVPPSAPGGTTPKKDDEFDPLTNYKISAEVQRVQSAAHFNLITQFLENSGFSRNDLPPELQAELAQLEKILHDKLWDVIDNLSPEQQQKLLDGSLRIYLYQKLLMQALRDPQFSALITKFYSDYTQLVVAKNPKEAEKRIDKIQEYFSGLSAAENVNSQEFEESLQIIRQEIQRLKAHSSGATPPQQLNQQQKQEIVKKFYQHILDPVTRKTLTDPNMFDSNVRQTMTVLERVYATQAESILTTLPAEKIAASLQRTDALSENGYAYQQLIISLLNQNQFSSLLSQFYKEAGTLLKESNTPEIVHNIFNPIQSHLQSISAASEVDSNELRRVTESLQAEIQTVEALIDSPATSATTPDLESDAVVTAPLAEAGTDSTTTVSIEDETVDHQPPPKIRFEPQQQSLLETYITSAGISNDVKQRRQIQDQSARVLWGTLAELFKDEVDQLNKLPKNMHDEVYTKTLNYILSLSPEELRKLGKSPAAMNRHVQILTYKLLGEAAFQRIYEQYSQFKTAETISRSGRIEKEATWAYENIVFELFSAHNITDPTVPDDNGYQIEFDTLKNQLKEKLFAYVEQLPTSDLINLYMHAKDRKQFLQEIYQYLNADQTFVQPLSAFYHKLLDLYEETDKPRKAQLQTSLNRLVQIDTTAATIKSNGPSSAELLDSSLKTILDTDSQVLIDYTDSTLRSIVLDIGLIRTLNLINGNDLGHLSLIFKIPSDMLQKVDVDSFRSLLSEYARIRASQLQTISYFPDQGFSTGTKERPVRASDEAANRIESVRTVQVIVQSKGKEGDEVLAHTTNSKTVKEKRNIALKIFGDDWDQLSQFEQAGIYRYYGLTFVISPEDLKKDISKRLPFPSEYIDFRAKKEYKSLLKDLASEYETHGVDHFNPMLLNGSREATPAADELRQTNQLMIVEETFIFAQLPETQQLYIAQQLGYATADDFIKEQTLAAEAAGLDDSLVQEWINSPLAEELMPENLDQSLTPTDKSFKDRFINSHRPVSKQVLLNSFKQLAGQKLTKEGLKAGAASLAAKAGMAAATGGLATLATIGMAVLSNKKIRDALMYGATYLTASTLYALSTIGGLLGGILGSAFGLVGGPVGAFGGGFLGTHVGAQIWPQQWGSWLGLNPRQVPSWGNFFSGEEPVTAAQASMQAQRAANTGVTSNKFDTASDTSGAIKNPAAKAVAGEKIEAAYSGSGSGATASSSGFFTGLGGLEIGLAAPLVGVIAVILLTFATVIVIMGAFITPLPTRNSSSGDNNFDPDNPNAVSQPGAEFVEITKIANITQIENNTPTEVTYTVTIKPRGANRIKFNSIEDTFNVYGEKVPSVMPTSVFSETYLGDILEQDFTTTYKVTVGADTMNAIATNSIIADFDVIDDNDFTIQNSQTYRVSESVKIGQPKVGCWPATGRLSSVPYNGGKTHITADAFDIAAVAGTPVYAPFDGTLSRYDTINDQYNDGYGRSMKLTSTIQGKTVTFVFAHLQSAEVAYGESKTVVGGELIGAINGDKNVEGINAGFSTGNHLHFEIKPIIPGLSLTELMDGQEEVTAFKANKAAPVNDCRE